MPPLTPDERLRFRRAWSLTRILAWALCFGAPVAYAGVLLLAVAKGVPGTLRAGPVLWRHPAVLGAFFLAAGMLGGVCLLAPFFRRSLCREPTLDRAVAVSRQATVVTCALLESVAIFGLVAGMLAGPGAAIPAFLLFLVPPVGYLILVPGPQAWLADLEDARGG